MLHRYATSNLDEMSDPSYKKGQIAALCRVFFHKEPIQNDRSIADQNLCLAHRICLPTSPWDTCQVDRGRHDPRSREYDRRRIARAGSGRNRVRTDHQLTSDSEQSPLRPLITRYRPKRPRLVPGFLFSLHFFSRFR